MCVCVHVQASDLNRTALGFGTTLQRATYSVKALWCVYQAVICYYNVKTVLEISDLIVQLAIVATDQQMGVVNIKVIFCIRNYV